MTAQAMDLLQAQAAVQMLRGQQRDMCSALEATLEECKQLDAAHEEYVARGQRREAELQRELQRVEQSQETLMERAEELSSTISQLTVELDSFDESCLQGLRSEDDRLRLELADMEDQLRCAEEEARHHSQRRLTNFLRYEQEMQERRELLEELRQEERTVSEALAEKVEENEDQAEELADRVVHVRSMRRSIAQVQSELAAAQAELDEAEEETETRTETLASTLSDLEETRHSLEVRFSTPAIELDRAALADRPAPEVEDPETETESQAAFLGTCAPPVLDQESKAAIAELEAALTADGGDSPRRGSRRRSDMQKRRDTLVSETAELAKSLEVKRKRSGDLAVALSNAQGALQRSREEVCVQHRLPLRALGVAAAVIVLFLAWLLRRTRLDNAVELATAERQGF